MTRTISAIVAGILAFSGITAVAQTRADMAKITCSELLDAYANDLGILIAWMSGYYNAKRNNTILDAKQLTANTQKVVEFCKTNQKTTVMKAIDQITKAKK